MELFMAAGALFYVFCSCVPVSHLFASRFNNASLSGAKWLLMVFLMSFVSKQMWGCVLLHVRLLSEGKTTIEHIAEESKAAAHKAAGHAMPDDAGSGHGSSGSGLAGGSGLSRGCLSGYRANAWAEEEVFGPRRSGLRRPSIDDAWVALVVLYGRSNAFRWLVRNLG